MAVKVRHHKGKYWVFIDHKGKRKAKCIGTSKRTAEVAAEKIAAKLTLGDFSLLDEKSQRPFDAYFRNWLDTYARAHCKASSDWFTTWGSGRITVGRPRLDRALCRGAPYHGLSHAHLAQERKSTACRFVQATH